ncbi:CdaR family protein [Paenisporosarcina indica]|uniref:CdaR family protein n=1 Tax=Paenisporosarcina indica TaxID=650093 RepID=UPI0009502125|nr:CdaR family protein [Paenisporosarcina indica]
MDKLMDNPWFLRITALLLAVLLFFTVQSEMESTKNVESTDITDVIQEIPVEVYYDDDNLIVTGVPQTVDMKISGPRAILMRTKALQDFTVFVDLRDTTIGEHIVRIQTENVSDKLQVELDTTNITVNIEERISMEFDVEPEINERLLKENFVIKNMTTDPNRIRVTGPKSVIENIEFVKATVSAEQGLNESFSQKVNIRVLDRNLGKLENVIIEPEHVKVTLEIEEYSKEVPIKVRQKGSPKEGVTINDLTPNITKVRLFGSRSVIDDLEAIFIDVDVSALDTSETVPIKVPVPKGVSRLSEKEVKVKVDVTSAPKVDTEKEESAQVKPIENVEVDQEVTSREFAFMNVEVRGLNDTDTYTFTQPESGQLTLTIQGEDVLINRLSATDFHVFVDASNVETGENQLHVTVEGPENVTWTVSIPSVNLEIQRA